MSRLYSPVVRLWHRWRGRFQETFYFILSVDPIVSFSPPLVFVWRARAYMNALCFYYVFSVALVCFSALLLIHTLVFCLLQALIEEYSPELTSKVGKLDSDPHLWMPVSHVDTTVCSVGIPGWGR